MESLRIRRARAALRDARLHAERIAATTAPGSHHRVQANNRVVTLAAQLRRILANAPTRRSLGID